MTNDIIFDYDKCRTDIFENGEFVVALDIPKIQANALCVALTERSDSYDFDWQYSGGRVCVRQLRRKDDGISSQWISVDERLPEYQNTLSEKDKCLALTKCGKIWMGFYNTHLKPDEWYLYGWSMNGGWHPFDITHWMQLPTPPKGD